MLYSGLTLPQSSYGLNGLWINTDYSFTSLNSYEFNPSGFSVINDWAFSFSYGGELSDNSAGNLYQFSAGRSFDKHFISLRYSPGFQKEFIFQSEVITPDNSESSVLESRYSYKELMGLGYSYKTKPGFSFGINIKLFEQEFNHQNLTAVFSDSVYFIRDNEQDKSNFWKADAGIVWKPFENLFLNLSSNNLLIINNETNNPTNAEFRIHTDRSLMIGAGYSPMDQFNLNLIYESNSSFQAAMQTYFNIGNNKLGFGFNGLHDNEQQPFIAGIVPSLIFSSEYFDFSLSWTKYLSDRNSAFSFEDFSSKGISNIINNRFSSDRLVLTANFKLNTSYNPQVRFIDININNSIYPALAERYQQFPFATAVVENLTGEKLEIKPAAAIKNVNDENIYSPYVVILPYDTVEVSFYTIIPDDFISTNTEISFADFYLQTSSDEYDDKIQKAILLNGKNAWDGNVHNLIYFIRKDRDFTISYAKNILTGYKAKLDTISTELTNFYKAKVLFNEITKDLVYISDPRATAEYVQHPEETINLQGGDCDDLSVCYSALLESVGIETALVDYKSENGLRHVNILFNTNLSPEKASLITDNDTKYFVRKNEMGIDEVWIPVETTVLSGFDNAWTTAAGKFQTDAINSLGLLKGSVEIIDVY